MNNLITYSRWFVFLFIIGLKLDIGAFEYKNIFSIKVTN
jgi:hypothetical protein